MADEHIGIVDRKYIKKKEERRKRMALLAEILDELSVLIEHNELPPDKYATVKEYVE